MSKTTVTKCTSKRSYKSVFVGQWSKNSKFRVCLFSVAFIPVKSGKAKAYVKYGNEPVPGSPLQIPIKPDIDVSLIKCTGPGVQNEGEFISKKFFSHAYLYTCRRSLCRS